MSASTRVVRRPVAPRWALGDTRRGRGVLAALVALVALGLSTACSSDAPGPLSEDTGRQADTNDASVPSDVEPRQLAPEALLTRVSVDLRGVRPTRDELERLAADPGALDTLIDEFLADPRFEARVRDWFAVPFRTRVDQYPADAAFFGIADDRAFQRAIGEEPLRILGRVAFEDLPWTEVVTGDWTMADEVLSQAWPVDYPTGASGWRVVHYVDGRPAAGVLSTNGLWWRYGSTVENYNRGRANAIARTLLCSDYLARPVTFPRTSERLDSEALVEQTRDNPACVSCHVSLDPLASYLFGFTYFDNTFVSPRYNVANERLWRTGTGLAPAYFGESGHDLSDLGVQIAGDPRFVWCAVETVYGALVGEGAGGDLDALTWHREAFLRSGVRLRALVRSVVDDPAYRAAVPRLLSVEQLASTTEAVTGFRWTFEGWDMLASDLIGVRTLAGGADGRDVTSPASTPSVSSLLVAARLAELASWHAVRGASGGESDLFAELGVDRSPAEDAAAARRQVALLIERAHGRRVPVDDPFVTDLLELWDAVAAIEGGTEAAWAAVLTALLRDPANLTY